MKIENIQNIIVGTLIIIFGSLCSYLFNFFNEVYPESNKRMALLEMNSSQTNQRLKDIQVDIREVRSKQDEIYKVIINERN